MGYICVACGETHSDLPAATFQGPDVWFQASEAEREGDFEKNSDVYIWKNEHFFIRCVLDIPLTDGEEPLSFGVWCSLSSANLNLYLDHWDDLERDLLPSMFGWLSNSLPGYPETLNLKSMIHPRSNGLRPTVELESTDHILAMQQREGISLARATQYLHDVGVLS